MNQYTLNIAGYLIRFETSDGGPDLVPSPRFTGFITGQDHHDVLIKVRGGSFLLQAGTEMVFNAPYVEETDGIPVKKNDEFWSIHRKGEELFIQTFFPNTEFTRKAILRFSLSGNCWDLWAGDNISSIDPMGYPLDGLILYYLTAINNDIMIHASGINTNGKGYLFSGVSGKGKSTMARLWDHEGARVIHDDRLIIRKGIRGFSFFNTPVYNNDAPSESPLDAIFLIEHGKENVLTPVNGAAAVSMVMANCIQHNWDKNIVSRLIGTVAELCSGVQVKKLAFFPDKSVTRHILRNE
jgi:hypothetical protein